MNRLGDARPQRCRKYVNIGFMSNKYSNLLTFLANGHVQVEHRDGAWGSPLFKKDPMIQLHGLSTALNYGTISLSAAAPSGLTRIL